MSKEYIADKATLDNVNSIVSALTNRWPDARAGKVDNIQAVLNTPDGNTLAAWLQSIANSAASAYNKANEANNNAANAANLASQANSNAWNAYQEAINAKNAANNATTLHSVIKFGTVIIDGSNQTCSIQGKGKAVFEGWQGPNLTITVDGRTICDRDELVYVVKNAGGAYLEIEFLQSIVCNCNSGSGYGYGAAMKYVLY